MLELMLTGIWCSRLGSEGFEGLGWRVWFSTEGFGASLVALRRLSVSMWGY